jgi:hypothetical protein
MQQGWQVKGHPLYFKKRRVTNMRKINWNPQEQIIEMEHIAPSPTPEPLIHSIVETVPVQGPIRTRIRNGNGHRSGMVRKLNDSERAWLKTKFLQKNGRIANDDCVTFKGQIISDCIAIFQITGYISVLHRYVAMGRLELRDLSGYLNWMHEKYQGLWTQYNNPRFTTARMANRDAVYEGRAPTATIPIEEVPIMTTAGPLSTMPNFKAFPKRRSYCSATT